MEIFPSRTKEEIVILLQWDPKLETGIKIIDDQHKQLYAITNDLLNACQENKGINLIESSLNFLGKYVLDHFSTEEEMHKKNNYPLSTEHKKYHENFVKEFNDLKTEIHSKGINALTVVNLNRFIGTWLRNHTNKSDKDFAQFMKNKK